MPKPIETEKPTVTAMDVVPRIRLFKGIPSERSWFAGEIELNDRLRNEFGPKYKGLNGERVIGAKYVRRVLGSVIIDEKAIGVQSEVMPDKGVVLFGQFLTAMEARKTAQDDYFHGSEGWYSIQNLAAEGHDRFVRTGNGLYLPLWDDDTAVPTIAELTPRYVTIQAEVLTINFVHRVEAIEREIHRLCIDESRTKELNPKLGEAKMAKVADQLSYGSAVGFRHFDRVEGVVVVGAKEVPVLGQRLNEVTTLIGDVLTKYQAYLHAAGEINPEKVRQQVEEASNSHFVRTKRGKLVPLNDGDRVIPATILQ